jgi:hypothetical protein
MASIRMENLVKRYGDATPSKRDIAMVFQDYESLGSDTLLDKTHLFDRKDGSALR